LDFFLVVITDLFFFFFSFPCSGSQQTFAGATPESPLAEMEAEARDYADPQLGALTPLPSPAESPENFGDLGSPLALFDGFDPTMFLFPWDLATL
jgi:hypothetical protein